jgi:hypothetical protein
VRKLREFNMALLGKWCWKMLADRGGYGSGFWRPVMEWRGGFRVGGRGGSSRWREVAKIRDGVGGIEGG